MKFLHFSDSHLGCWKDDLMNFYGLMTFENILKNGIKEKVDFIIIAGDIFDNSYPKIDILKQSAKILKEVKENNIPVYEIAGSHDYSPTDKTILKVFESAGLMINVFKANHTENNQIHLDFIEDRSGAKIAGIIGRVRGTDLSIYEYLDRENLEEEKGFKIFVFHNAITEEKDDELSFYDSISKSFLPQNFNYYAGGHIHNVLPSNLKDQKNINATSPIVYPGCIFPTNFAELESGDFGGYCIVKNTEGSWINIEWKNEKVIDVLPLIINVNNKTVKDISDLIEEKINIDMNQKIVTLRIEGEMKTGNPSDINFRDIEKKIYDKGAIRFFRNTRKLISKQSLITKSLIGSSREEIENKIIKDNIDKVKVSKWNKDKEEEILKNILSKCGYRRGDSKVKDFNDDKIKLLLNILGINDIWEKYE